MKDRETEVFVRDSASELYRNMLVMHNGLVDEYRRENKRRMDAGDGLIPSGEYPQTVVDRFMDVRGTYDYPLSAMHQMDKAVDKVLPLVSGHDCECDFDESNMMAHIDVDDGRRIRMRLSNHRPKGMPRIIVSVSKN